MRDPDVLQTDHSCIEDENDLRSDIVEELTDAGYTARQAANGIEAVKLLERERPDLVLCDITMPGLSGYGVLRAMREKGSLADVPFIFITALGERNDLLVGKQAGADDYLVKPLDYDLLLATVAARLNQVDRVRKEAVRRAEETWRELVETSRSQAIDSMRSAASAFDRFLIGVVVLDPSGKVRLVNNEAQRILDEDDGFCLSEGMLKGERQADGLRECAEPGPRGRKARTRSFRFRASPTSGPTWSSCLVRGRRKGTIGRAVVLLVIDTEQRTKVSGETLVRLYTSHARRDAGGADAHRRKTSGSDRRGTRSGADHHRLPLEEPVPAGDAPAGGPRPGPALGSAADEFPLKRFQVKCLGSGADDAVSDSRNRRNDRLCGELFSLRFRPAEAAEECDP